MFKVSRVALAAILFTGAADISFAQPPGPGRPGGFEKKDFPRREASERKDGERANATPAEALERELQQLRARIGEVEAQLKKAREGDAKRDEPKRDGPPMVRGPFGPGGPMGSRSPMGFGGFGPGRGGPGGPMGPGGFGAGGSPGFTGPGMHLPLEHMSPEQIKQLIGRLQQALEAKSRGGDQPKKPEGGKGGPSQEDVMKRLERINKELEEIRRSLGK